MILVKYLYIYKICYTFAGVVSRYEGKIVTFCRPAKEYINKIYPNLPRMGSRLGACLVFLSGQLKKIMIILF